MEEAKGSEATDREVCTREELTNLVRAIKFAYPEMSMRAVYREISENLSQKENFSFLKHIQLKDVKRVWKKAIKPAAVQQQQEASNLPILPTDVMKLYTVGDGTVRTLAQEYSQSAAAAAAAEAATRNDNERRSFMEHYVHVFLDVPADRSGSRPHQALIHFHDNDSAMAADASSQAKQKDRREIVKIQVAASPDDTPYPMLMYNADRSLKTFIHFDPQDDGYHRIREWIVNEGSGGALGSSGGTKAYFYSRLTKRKNGANIISIDVSGLAPPQSW